MRYIKLFESDKSEYYVEITDREFSYTRDNIEEDWFTRSEWKKIDSLMKEMDPLKTPDNRVLASTLTNHLVIYHWNYIGQVYRIEKYEDDYYCVSVSYISIVKSNDGYHGDGYSEKRRLCDKYYKCDQIDGLLELIKDTIKDVFTIEVKKSKGS